MKVSISLSRKNIHLLTGVRPRVLHAALARYRATLPRRGRPRRHAPITEVVLAFMVMRHDMTLRLVEALSGVDHVTLMRITHRVIAALGRLAPPRNCGAWIVDGTHVRWSSREAGAYTGYRKARTIKAQVICDETGWIEHADGGFLGSMHDKAIWDRLVGGISPPGVVLADKGYAGGIGEGTFLARPARRNERNPPGPVVPDHARRRVVVEHVFARIKVWRCMRWWRRDARSHNQALKMIAWLLNEERNGA